MMLNAVLKARQAAAIVHPAIQPHQTTKADQATKNRKITSDLRTPRTAE